MGFAMIELDEFTFQLKEASKIWQVPQFTVTDVCGLTGATPKALEHFVDPSRGMVRLLGNHVNPGKGKRRMFTGGQVLMIKAAYVMNSLGFPQRFSMAMSESVLRRAESLTFGTAVQTNMTILTYPMKNGDWAVVPIYTETDKEPNLPLAVQALDVDRLVSETKAQLEAIVAGEEIPNFDVPDIEPDPNPYSPASNFFRAWDKDDINRWKYVGLNWDESQELMAMQGVQLNGDDLEIIPKADHSHERWEELFDRHERARLKACGLSDED